MFAHNVSYNFRTKYNLTRNNGHDDFADVQLALSAEPFILVE